MRFAVRNFLCFDDWVEFDSAAITLLVGPNGSGKSALIRAAILLQEQRDIWRLSFAGSESSLRSFVETAGKGDPLGTIGFRLWFSIDALDVMAPREGWRGGSLEYRFLLELGYGKDDFGGGSNGVLVEMKLQLLEGTESAETGRINLFSIDRSDEGYDLYMNTNELLALPYLFERAMPPEPGENGPGQPRDLDRVLVALKRLRPLAAPRRKEAIAELTAMTEARKREILLEDGLLDLLAVETGGNPKVEPFPLRIAEKRGKLVSRERKYLQSIADLFVLKALSENGIGSIASRLGEKRIRVSFYSLFYEILEAAGFNSNAKPGDSRRMIRIPRRGNHSSRFALAEEGTAAGALVDKAREDYAARIRNLVNEAALRNENGLIEFGEDALSRSYLEILEAASSRAAASSQKETGELRLIGEGGEIEPGILDLEIRTGDARRILREFGIADDFELSTAEGRAPELLLVRKGRRLSLDCLGSGQSFIVLLVIGLLYRPWGSRFILENPEAALHPAEQARIGDLLLHFRERYGAGFLVETQSEALVRRLGDLAIERKLGKKEMIVHCFGEEGRSRGVALRSGSDLDGLLKSAFAL